MKKVLRTRGDWGASDETTLRRWQSKWKIGSAKFLVAAHDRTKSIRDARVLPAAPRFPRELAEILGTSPAWRQLKAIESMVSEMPYFKLVQQVAELPIMKLMKRAEELPITRLMRDLEESPDMRFIRQLQNLPHIRLAQQLGNSSLERFGRIKF